MNRIQLSQNFYLDEFTRSQTAVRHGIDMSVPEFGVTYFNLRRLCRVVLQPVRDALGPVHITSGYRPPKLNRKIGGASTSQHLYGQAADIVVTGHTPLEVATWIRDNLLTYDQLIHEYGDWVHVSVTSACNADVRRLQLLTAIKVPRPLRKPRTVYLPGLLSIDDAQARYHNHKEAA